MDLNTILRLLVIISCCSLIVRVILSRSNWGWLGVAISILSLMGVSFWIAPEKAGFIGLFLWLVFVLIPILGLRQVNYWIYQEKFQQAKGLAFCLSLLHPADGWQEQPKFLQALALTQNGNIEKAEALLSRYAKQPQYGFQHTAKAIRLRMEARWEECLRWLTTEVSPQQLWQNSTLATVYLRTLGEVGDLNGLIWAVQSHQEQLQHLGNGMSLNLARLYVFAFSGDVQEVQKLLASTLKVYPKNVQKFWLATAEIAAGNQEVGQKILFNIKDQDWSLKAAIAGRLDQPCPEAKLILTAESIRMIAALKQKLQEEINYGGAIKITPTKADLTYSVMMINVLVFLLEIQQGGSQNLETLHRLGAAIPEAIISGEPWRIFTANFLHYGLIHLGSNLLGLWILGPYVEFYLGWLRYLIIYVMSGMAAITVFTLVTLATGQGDETLVGASAAIMGLMGATFMILWQGWRQEKSQLAQERLRLVVTIIALQVVFDLSIANVSFLGHFFGLVFGMIMTRILLSFRYAKSSNMKKHFIEHESSNNLWR